MPYAIVDRPQGPVLSAPEHESPETGRRTATRGGRGEDCEMVEIIAGALVAAGLLGAAYLLSRNRSGAARTAPRRPT